MFQYVSFILLGWISIFLWKKSPWYPQKGETSTPCRTAKAEIHSEVPWGLDGTSVTLGWSIWPRKMLEFAAECVGWFHQQKWWISSRKMVIYPIYPTKMVRFYGNIKLWRTLLLLGIINKIHCESDLENDQFHQEWLGRAKRAEKNIWQTTNYLMNKHVEHESGLVFGDDCWVMLL